MNTCAVRFMPADVTVQARRGDNLLQIAVEAGVHINASCGGDGACGKCRVVISSGDVDCTECEKLSPEEYAKGWRLACRTTVQGNAEVLISEESVLDKKAVREARIHAHEARHVSPETAEAHELQPPVRAYCFGLVPPTIGDNASDLTRLQRSLRKEFGIECSSIDIDALKSLPLAARAGNWQITAAMTGAAGSEQVVQIDSGDTVGNRCCIAFDIGTTSLWGHIISLNGGRLLAEASTYNPQIKFGDDVISRIVYSQKQSGLKELQHAVVAELQSMIDALLRDAGIEKNSLSHITAAGNTVMTHLLLGIDPKYLREAPYVPAASIIPPFDARSIGFSLNWHVPLFVLPSVASYVGGDIVAGVVASGMHKTEKLTLYIDIGTNGEIVLGNRDWLMTASCSAGPAFEGGGLKCGMRATSGAIEGFSISDATLEPMIVTIGRKRPSGICGSGAINILAEFMQTGIIARNGKFDRSLAAGRVREGAEGVEYVLAEGKLSGTGKDIIISEADIGNIMRAKAAMFAGCHALLEKAGLLFDNLEQVVIAGAFGDYIDLEKAIMIGLFPDIPRERYRFIGNGSLLGAQLTALSIRHLETSEKVARRMTNIELSEDPSFMDKYIAGIFLPHTDAALFPSVTARSAKFERTLG